MIQRLASCKANKSRVVYQVQQQEGTNHQAQPYGLVGRLGVSRRLTSQRIAFMDGTRRQATKDQQASETHTPNSRCFHVPIYSCTCGSAGLGRPCKLDHQFLVSASVDALSQGIHYSLNVTLQASTMANSPGGRTCMGPRSLRRIPRRRYQHHRPPRPVIP